MKRRIFAFVTALVLSLSLCLTAQAESFAVGGFYDFSGLTTAEEQQMLGQMANEISAQYNVGVYGFIMDDYWEYSDVSMEDAADVLYDTMPEEDALLLILSMAERDYLLIAYGEYGHYAFNDEGRQYLTDYFLDDFANDDWVTGFEDYFSWAGDYMEAANAGEPYSGSNIPMGTEEKMVTVLFMLGVSLLIAWLRGIIMSRKMRSVAMAHAASDYAKGGIQLSRRSDVFTHRTVSRQKIQQNTTRSSGGGSTVRSSGGGHGTRGKF